MRLRTLVPLLAVLLLAPAIAQVPGAGDPVSIEGPAEASASADDAASFTLTVTSGGASSGSPFDQFGAADVTVAATGVPDGWTVALEPSGFALDPGTSQDVQVTVVIEPGSNADAATLRFTATLTSPDTSGLIFPSGEATTDVVVSREDTATRELLEFLGPGVWAVLGALLVAVIVAGFLLVDRGRSILRMTSPEAEATCIAGGNVTVHITVENVSAQSQHVSIQAHSADHAWKVSATGTDAELAPGESHRVAVKVRAPSKGVKGSRAVIRAVAVPSENPKATAVAAFPVRIE